MVSIGRTHTEKRPSIIHDRGRACAATAHRPSPVCVCVCIVPCPEWSKGEEFLRVVCVAIEMGRG